MDFPLDFVRKAFPALAGTDRVFFDNAAGAQAPERVISAVEQHLRERNVQRGGRYSLSRDVDEVISRARESLQIFLNAYSPDEIVFGLNATGLVRMASLAIAEMLEPGDEIVVTEMDHEANIAPWLELEKRGIKIKFWPVERDTARLDLDRLDGLMTDRTRLVAMTKGSNAIGTIVDLIPVADRIHERKGYLFVDGVHFAPHGPVDVRFLRCDFLVCSGYKIFGPHMAFLWGRKEVMDALPTFRHYFIRNQSPDKFEVGTVGFEAIAGMAAAIDYIEDLGQHSHAMRIPLPPEEDVVRRKDVRRGMQAIRHYERTLSQHTLTRLAAIPGVRVYGVDDPEQAARRTPTFCYNVDGVRPQDVCQRLAERGIFVRDGHFYCPRLIKRLGLPEEGALRASLVHYNSFEEVDRWIDVLEKMS